MGGARGETKRNAGEKWRQGKEGGKKEVKELKGYLKTGQLNPVQITASDCLIVLKGFSVKVALLCDVLQELLRLLPSKKHNGA